MYFQVFNFIWIRALILSAMPFYQYLYKRWSWASALHEGKKMACWTSNIHYLGIRWMWMSGGLRRSLPWQKCRWYPFIRLVELRANRSGWGDEDKNFFPCLQFGPGPPPRRQSFHCLSYREWTVISFPRLVYLANNRAQSHLPSPRDHHPTYRMVRTVHIKVTCLLAKRKWEVITQHQPLTS